MSADFTRAFDMALRGGPLPPGLIAPDLSEVARRFDVYRNNVAVSLSTALAARFPVIERLVGQAFFAAMARVYAEQDRPNSPVLHEWGQGFAAFLAAFPPLASYPYMADVARIEYARGCAYHAADGTPADPARFATANPATVRLVLHASVILLPLDYPAVTIWQANQPATVAPPLQQVTLQPETALIYRDRSFQVPVMAVSPADATFVSALQAHETLADAAAHALAYDAGYDPTPLLLRLMQAGLFLEPESC
ncbi:MAG: putative DNA-binding domain-containing protein [Rhodobacteraceae bacterium]|jgi:hypothetical protein|nr:putative DNA-binding domain-containing protein [Paracoccaceae bacterium]